MYSTSPRQGALPETRERRAFGFRPTEQSAA
jgi:hypothetical protein